MCITDLFPIPAGPPEGRRSGAGPAGGSCLYDWQDDVKTCLCWTALDDAIGLLNCSSEMNQGRDSEAITSHPQCTVPGRPQSLMFNTWPNNTFLVKHFTVYKELSSVYKKVFLFSSFLSLSLKKNTFGSVCFSTHFADEERKELW